MPDENDPLAVDWCLRAAKLREVEMAFLAGEMLTEARFGADLSRYANASLGEVRRALDEAIRNCQISRGEKPTRRRFAVRGIMRPY